MVATIAANYRRASGFTLIEVMLVVIIIAALAAMITPRLVGRSEQAKISVARSDIDGNSPSLVFFSALRSLIIAIPY